MSGKPAHAWPGATLVVRTGLSALLGISLLSHFLGAQERYVEQRTASGILQGMVSADGQVRSFKGVPYAAPPVGPLRWKAPQPAAPWTGVRQVTEFAARCMQAPVYPDMTFLDYGTSEDCLYLNLWMPAAPSQQRLPVMVWIHGGGFAAGSSSEPRQDGANLSRKGLLVVSMNYRLGIFGFFSHPALARESGHDASGNYGLLDQVAALRWVHDNIAAFGGDPGNVTVFGESAGSFSVSALMASPLAQGLFQRAIGESGAFFGETLRLRPRAETEKAGMEFAKSSLGTGSLGALRAMPAKEVLEAVPKAQPFLFAPNIDGYFLPESVEAIFAAGKQSRVPLLAGWNADEGSSKSILGKDLPTPENFRAHVRSLYGADADTLLNLYPAATAAQARRSARDLSGDRFIAYGAWKWIEAHLNTGHAPIFRYEFDQTLPLPPGAAAGTEAIAPHAGEIEYVFQVLSSKNLPWRAEDRKLSESMGSYWSNFAKAGDPNGSGLPRWPVYTQNGYAVLHLAAEPHAAADDHRARYRFLDGVR
jgi:para-nitrobenzyl esterase